MEADRKVQEAVVLIDRLRQACWDTGSPVVPASVAQAISALVMWRGENGPR